MNSNIACVFESTDKAQALGDLLGLRYVAVPAGPMHA